MVGIRGSQEIGKRVLMQGLGSQKTIHYLNTRLVSDVAWYPYIAHLFDGMHLPSSARDDSIFELKTGPFESSRKETFAEIGSGYMALIPSDNQGDSIYSHLQALSHVLGLIPAMSYQEEEAAFVRGKAVQIHKDEDSVSLESRIRFPRAYFPKGLIAEEEAKIEELRIRTTLGEDGYSSKIESAGGNIINPFFDLPRAKDLVLRHSSLVEGIIRTAEDQNLSPYSYEEEYVKEHISPRLTHVDRWNKRAEDMFSSARFLASIISRSALAGYIHDVILYGSLARDDRVPDDIDMLVIVDDPDKRVLNPKDYSEEEMMVETFGEGLVRYDIEAITDGLFEEMGLVPQMRDYAVATYGIPQGEEMRWRVENRLEEPNSMPLGKVGATVDLNSVYLADIANEEGIRHMMQNKFSPAYFRDIFRDGLLYDQVKDTFIPARVRYAETLDMSKRLLTQACDEGWLSHLRDPRKSD